MKKALFFAAVATIFASCSSDVLYEDNTLANDYNDCIQFENTFKSNSTRTSKDEGKTFVDGDKMGIYGFQTSPNATVDKIFNNQLVSYDGTEWTYSPLKYWSTGSAYKFYGIYPHSATDYTFDVESKLFTIPTFVVKDAIADQVDLMIAEENNAQPFNTVNMTYNHILANVNFKGKVSTNVQGFSTAKINSFTISGLKNTGNFEQTGFNSTNKNVEGVWKTVYGAYNFPTTTDIAMTTDAADVITDLLMLPQVLDAELTVNYTISYSDQTSTTFERTIPMRSIMYNNNAIDHWAMNTYYTYTMILDPTKSSNPDLSTLGIDWDGSENGDCEPTPGSKLVGPDANGVYMVDTDGDGVGDYAIAWEDLDGDGKLEGGVDRDNDGKIDNVDLENVNNAAADALAKDLVSDGNPNNPEGRDIILYDSDGDGVIDSQLEAVYVVGPDTPTQYPLDWNGSNDADNNTSTAAEDETKPVNNSRLVVDADGNCFVEYDADGDGVIDPATERFPVHWADLDGDGKEEGYIGNVDGENENHSTSDLVTDANTENPEGYDVILLDTDGDGVCDTQLERTVEIDVPDVDSPILFDAEVEDWNEKIATEVVVTK